MRKLTRWLGLGLTLAASVTGQQDNRGGSDPRLARLTAFLLRVGSPLHHLAEDFLVAADIHHLDWRLLPSISYVESGAGKNCLRNNIFGWKSAQGEFRSVREAIYHVAARLAHSKLYTGKDLNRLLATYNHHEEWAARIKSIMSLVDPTEPLKARQAVEVVADWTNPAAELQSTDRPAPEP